MILIPMIRNTKNAYGTIAKSFHWTIFILVTFMLIYGFLLEDISKEYQPIAYNIHKLTGLLILFLMLFRLAWALTNIKPGLPVGMMLWERVGEWIVHVLLYVTLIAMPFVGWIGASAGGRPPHIGSLSLGLPLEENKQFSESAFFIHNNLALIIIGLISIHILAALYHHFIKHDDIMRRMLPRIFLKHK